MDLKSEELFLKKEEVHIYIGTLTACLEVLNMISLDKARELIKNEIESVKQQIIEQNNRVWH